MPFNGTFYNTTPLPTFVSGQAGFGLAVSFLANSGQGIGLPMTPVGPFDAPYGTAFTFECFFRISAYPTNTVTLATRSGTWWLQMLAGGKLSLGIAGTTATAVSPSAVTLNTWHHVAVVYSGNPSNNFWYMCLDGTCVVGGGLGSYVGGFIGPVGQAIGTDGSSNSATFAGYIDEVRVSSGPVGSPGARYTGTTYTPPTAPFTVDANTVAIYHLDGNTLDSTGISLFGPGGGSAYPTATTLAVGVGAVAGASAGSIVNSIVVNLSDGGAGGTLPTSVTLSSGQTNVSFNYVPPTGVSGTDITITATPASGNGVSPASNGFHVFTSSAYVHPATAPYGIGFPGLASTLGFTIDDLSGTVPALRWAPLVVSGINIPIAQELGTGSGVYAANVLWETT